MDLKVAKEKWGDRICLWGNIDLVKALPYRTVEALSEKGDDLINYSFIGSKIFKPVYPADIKISLDLIILLS